MLRLAYLRESIHCISSGLFSSKLLVRNRGRGVESQSVAGQNQNLGAFDSKAWELGWMPGSSVGKKGDSEEKPPTNAV